MIRKFALKTVLKNKTKSICAVVAMFLTTIMFCTLYTTVVGIHNAQEYSNIKSIGTMGQVVLKNCDKETENAFNKIKENDKVESVGYRQYLADVINEELRYSVEFSYEDSIYSEHCFQQLISGHMPYAINEVVMDKGTMAVLGIKTKVGEPVILDLKIGTEHFQEKFILSGWFNQNTATEIKTGQVIVSKDYAKYWNENHTKEDVYGQTTIDILLRDNKNIEEQIDVILSDAGINDKVDYSINPAYMQQGFLMDIDNLIISLIGIVIIVIIGFLIIHNIFYIATLKEAKEYGRLKALGMNKSQIGKFVKWQATYLLMIAIPLGVLSGYFIGKKLIPILLSQTNLRGVENVNLIQTQDFLLVLMLSIIFVVFTTIISIYGPLRKVKSLSPIESEKIELKLKKNTKATSDGNKLYKFAYHNINRNRKNVLLVVMSVTFTIMLIGISYSLIGSFDVNKYLSKMLYSDYKVGTENFFTSNYLLSDGTVADIPDEIINEIKKENIVKKDGIVYGSCDDASVSIIGYDMKREDYLLNFYGIDKFNIREEMFVEDNVNLAPFYDGEGILEGVWLNEDGSIMQTDEVHKVGESITIQTSSGQQKTYTVLGHVKLGESIINSGIYGDNTFELYVSSNSYKDLISEPKIMAYSFDVRKGEETHAKDIMNTLTEKFSEIDYRSKESYVAEFQIMKKIVETVSVLLCIVFSIIALVNLINVFLTSVVMRKNEFVTLRSIGMKRKQMRKVLLYEILYYTSSSVILAVGLSLIISITIIENICNSMEFLSYSFKSGIFVWVYAVILVIDFCIVYVIEKHMNKDTIANQLKQKV